jgi:hypothetical protein
LREKNAVSLDEAKARASSRRGSDRPRSGVIGTS